MQLLCVWYGTTVKLPSDNIVIFSNLLWWYATFISYAASIGATHFQASAKQDKGIKELFLELSKSKSINMAYWGDYIIVSFVECCAPLGLNGSWATHSTILDLTL